MFDWEEFLIFDWKGFEGDCWFNLFEFGFFNDSKGLKELLFCEIPKIFEPEFDEILEKGFEEFFLVMEEDY